MMCVRVAVALSTLSTRAILSKHSSILCFETIFFFFVDFLGSLRIWLNLVIVMAQTFHFVNSWQDLGNQTFSKRYSPFFLFVWITPFVLWSDLPLSVTPDQDLKVGYRQFHANDSSSFNLIKLPLFQCRFPEFIFNIQWPLTKKRQQGATFVNRSMHLDWTKVFTFKTFHKQIFSLGSNELFNEEHKIMLSLSLTHTHFPPI